MSEDTISSVEEQALKKDVTKNWQRHMEAYKLSGLSQASYCREKDLTYNMFSYWRRKLLKPRGSSREIKLVEVKRVIKRINSNPMSLSRGSSIRVWVGGVCVEVGEDFSPVLLRQIMEVIREL
jgi:hypothetical protein